MKNDYYTYAYLREDGTPYYVGKGKGNRAFSKNRKVAVPPKDRILFLKRNLTEEEAFRHEIYMIALYGRKDIGTGILWNFSDGGEGASGVVFSEKRKRQLSEARKGKKKPPRSEEHRQNLGRARKGMKLPNEWREKIREGMKKAIRPADIGKRISEGKRGGTRPPCTEETRRKLSEANKGRKRSAATVEKIKQKLRKKVEVVFPSGRIGVFNSRKLATSYLPFSLDSLVRLLEGKPSSFREKGYSARYLP
jgi:hypothetical protein